MHDRATTDRGRVIVRRRSAVGVSEIELAATSYSPPGPSRAGTPGALTSCQFCAPCCLLPHFRTIALLRGGPGLEPTQEMAEDTREARSAAETGNTDQRSPRTETIRIVLRSEAAVAIGVITTALFYAFSDALLSDLLPDMWSIVLFVWLFSTMLWCAFDVVRHADCLAELLGEPYGTLILTFAVISIEVGLISSIMLRGANEPTLARDTMFAELMIMMNGMVGLELLVGAGRRAG